MRYRNYKLQTVVNSRRRSLKFIRDDILAKRVERLLTRGKTAVDIALLLHKPLSVVNEAIAQIKQYAGVKAA